MRQARGTALLAFARFFLVLFCHFGECCSSQTPLCIFVSVCYYNPQYPVFLLYIIISLYWEMERYVSVNSILIPLHRQSYFEVCDNTVASPKRDLHQGKNTNCACKQNQEIVSVFARHCLLVSDTLMVTHLTRSLLLLNNCSLPSCQFLVQQVTSSPVLHFHYNTFHMVNLESIM